MKLTRMMITGWMIGATVFSIRAQERARQEVINAEFQFAEAASTFNTKEAFMKHLSPDGLIVREGELVNGIEDWQKRQPNNALLSWYPAFVDVAPSEEMGLSTGPWEFRRARGDSTAVAFGHFVSIWKKQTDGTWKVVLDIGTSHPAATNREAPLSRGTVKTHSTPKQRQLHEITNDMLDQERILIEEYGKQGTAVLAEHLAENARIYRAGSVPVLRRSAQSMFSNTSQVYSFSMIKGETALSGDWGYVYGNAVVRVTENGKEEDAKASYMRVWRKDQMGKWSILVDVVTL